VVSSPSSRPEIRRFVRGRKDEVWSELARTLLELIADYAAVQEVGCMWCDCELGDEGRSSRRRWL
jgi:hypothetical protein